MALRLIETVIDDVKGYLNTNMAAKLDVLDAEYGDFSLDDIQQYYIAEVLAVPEQPAIFVIGDNTGIGAEGPSYLEGNHRLTVSCLATDQDTERLRRRLYRYVRAILELMRDAREANGWNLTFESLEYSPMYGTEGTFLADARLVLVIGKVEIE